MNIWLIQTAEPLPIDSDNERLLRTGILANLLVAKGHEVTWWASTFDHVKKAFRFHTDTNIEVAQNFHIKLLHVTGYRRNVSLRRILNHYLLAKKFALQARKELPPDLVLCSYPIIELSSEATKYGREMNLPVVLDIRDLWPDEFLNLLPAGAEWFGRIGLWPMFRQASAALRRAYAITGITPNLVHWGVEKAKRNLSSLDQSFYFGYVDTPPSTEAICQAELFWQSYGVSKNDGWFNVCFLGTISHLVDFETVMTCAYTLKRQRAKIRFIICGQGDQLDLLKSKSVGCENIVFPGWVGRDEIWVLMRLSSVGISPFRNVYSYQNSVSNKTIEYLSAGLPVLSCLKGVVRDLLLTHQCGFIYESGNAQELARILRWLSEEPQHLDRASKNAMALYHEKFRAEKVYSDMIVYLQKVLDSHENEQSSHPLEASEDHRKGQPPHNKGYEIIYRASTLKHK